MGSPSESPHITLFEPRCEEQLEAADSNSSPWPPAHTSENTVAFEESPSETSHPITPAPEVKDSDSSTVSPKMEPSRSGPSTIEEVQPKLSDDGLKACLALDSREGKSKLLRQEILRVEEEGTLEDPNTNTWQPFFLRKSTLWGLMSLFISQILTLITLFSYSSHNGGIVPVAARYHQAWKYGPNAILVINSALWSQVEIRAKQVTSWGVFLADPHANWESECFKTDYLSKNNFVALFSSLRKGHWTVTLSILGTLLLQLTAIVSTSLLERQVQPLSYTLDNLRTSASFSRIANSNADVSGLGGRIDDIVEVSNGFFNKAEVGYPAGTTGSLAFQPIELPVDIDQIDDDKVPGSKTFVTASVEYFIPGITCRPLIDRLALNVSPDWGKRSWHFGDVDVNVTLNTNITGNEPPSSLGEWGIDKGIEGNMTVYSEHETIADIPVAWRWVSSEDAQSPHNTTALCETTRFGVYATDCGEMKNETRHLDWLTDMVYVPQRCGDHNLVMVGTSCRSADQSVANMTITLLNCMSDDHHGEATIKTENRRDGPPPEIVLLEEFPLAEGEPYANNLLPLALLHFRNHHSFKSDLESLAKEAGEKIMQAQSAKHQLEAFYPFLAVPIFRASSFIPANETVSGKLDQEILRLTVKPLAFWSMAAGLAILITVCAVLVLIAAKFNHGYSLPKDPTTIAASTVLLHLYSRIKDAPQETSIRERDSTTHRWWRPWGTTGISKWLTVGAVLGAIGLLQATLITSTSVPRQGLVLVTVDGWDYYGWTLVPTFAVTILGLAVSSIEFNLRIIEPFADLKHEHSTALKFNALFENHMFGMLPWRLWALVRTRHFALSAIAVAAMSMPLCLVVIGDLFATSTEPAGQGTYTLLQLDGFDEATSESWDFGAHYGFDGFDQPSPAPRADPWTLYNISPLHNFTTDTFAMGAFEVANSQTMELKATKSLSLSTTVATGRLNCTVFDSQCRVTARPSFLNSSIPIPCNEWTWTVPNYSYAQREGCTQKTTPGSKWTYYGCSDHQAAGILDSDTLDCRSGERYRDIFTYEHDEAISFLLFNTTRLIGRVNDIHSILFNATEPAPNCDSVGTRLEETNCLAGIEYGEEVIGDCAASSRTMAICDPYLEIGEADIILSLPDLTVQSVTRNSSATLSARAHFASQMSMLLEDWQDTTFRHHETPERGPDDDLTSVFMDILSSSETSNSVSLNEFQSSDPESRAKVFSALETRWARFIAQLIRRKGLTVSRYDPPKVVNATVVDYDRRWLVQNEVSTRILQCLLGLAAICLISGFVFGNKGMDKVLPFSPTSIGALVKLLEGSKIVGYGQQQGEMGVIEPGIDISQREESDESGTVCDGNRSDGGLRTREQSVRPARGGKWAHGIIPPGAVDMSDVELRRILDVPGRVYCLKEWDLEVEMTEENANTKSEGGVDGTSGTGEIKTRYGIDFEEVPEDDQS